MNAKEQQIFDEIINNSARYAFAFLTGHGEEMFSDEVKSDDDIDYFDIIDESEWAFRNEFLNGWLSVENMEHIANREKLCQIRDLPDFFCLSEGRDAFTSGVMFGNNMRKDIENSWKRI